MPLFVKAQGCNWKNRITSFYLTDSCMSSYSVIHGRVTLSSTSNIKYSWKTYTPGAANWAYPGSSYWFYPGSNGAYTICLTLTDTARKCDTTICRTINFQCLTACNWKSQNINFYYRDSCKSYGSYILKNSINGQLTTNGNYISKYKYQWKINGTVIHDSSGILYYPVNANGTYVMCVKVTDTVNNCDTTLCKTFNVTCVSNCNWKGRNPSFTAWDSCYKPTKTNQIIAGISFNGSYSGKYPCSWTVNGTPATGSGPVLQHTVTSNGTYTVCVKVRDTINKCDTTFCKTVLVNCLPCGKFKSLISQFYVKDTCDQYPNKTQNRYDGVVGWVNMAGNGIYRFKWTVNSTTASPYDRIDKVLSNGTYTVCLTITDTVSKCDTTICRTITVNCKTCVNWKSKFASFSVRDTCDQYPGKIYNRVDGLQGQLQFVNSSDYYYYKYKWTINSAQVSTFSGFFKYLPNGTYTVCLTVRDTIKNCDTTMCRTVTVNCSPCVSWKSRITSLKIFDSCSQSYKMISGKVTLSNSTNVTYEWKVLNTGDVTWPNRYNIYTYYPGSNGSYTVCLTLRDNAKNCDTTICKTINFQCLPACKWWKQHIALSTWDSCKSRGDTRNTITGMLTTNNNYNSYYKYEWKINGSSIQNKNGFLNLGITSNGTYTMCVKVTDSANNCDTTICYTFNVTCITNCNWKGLNPSLVAYDSCNKNTKTYKIMGGISFNGSYSGKYPAEWSINGTKIPGTGPAFSHTVSNNGTYTVCVKVRDTLKKCDTTLCRTVIVDCIPCGNWKSQIKTLYVNDTCNRSFNGIVGWVSFNSSAPTGRFRYKWTVNNAQVSTGSRIDHGLTANGNYTVCLNIRDTVGKCDTTICRMVSIYCFRVGINAFNKQFNSLNVYPSPAGNSFGFDWNGEPCHYEVSDVLGQQLISGTTVNGPNTINSEKLPDGIYWIRLFGSEGNYSSKVVITH